MPFSSREGMTSIAPQDDHSAWGGGYGRTGAVSRLAATRRDGGGQLS